MTQKVSVIRTNDNMIGKYHSHLAKQANSRGCPGANKIT